MPRDFIVDAPPMRYVIVHYHIFKNGGSTIEHILDREFGDSFASLHGPSPDAVLDRHYLAAFLRMHPNVSAVSSHHLRYPLPSIRNTVLFDCCFLRDPIARLRSLYTYCRLTDFPDPLFQLARELDPAGFIRRLIHTAPHIISNVQVTQLSNAGAFSRPAGEYDLRRASAVVERMSFPGLVEVYEESLVAAEFFLKPAFPSIQLDCLPRNVTVAAGDGRDLDAALIEFWGAEAYQALVRLNGLDLELCRRMRKEVMRRLSLVPDAERRLDEFRLKAQTRSQRPPR